MRGLGALFSKSRMPLSQAELCRQKAIECEREAERAPSPVTAEAWLKMATQWRDLADQIQRYNRPSSP